MNNSNMAMTLLATVIATVVIVVFLAFQLLSWLVTACVVPVSRSQYWGNVRSLWLRAKPTQNSTLAQR